MNSVATTPDPQLFKLAFRSFTFNTAALVTLLLGWFGGAWIIWMAAILTAPGLFYFILSFSRGLKAHSWGAFMTFVPALTIQVVVFAIYIFSCWFLLNLPDSATS